MATTATSVVACNKNSALNDLKNEMKKAEQLLKEQPNKPQELRAALALAVAMGQVILETKNVSDEVIEKTITTIKLAMEVLKITPDESVTPQT